MSNPLWMPEGSVRALLAIGLIGAALYIGVYYATVSLVPPDENPVVPWILNTAGMVLAFYFGVKVGKKTNGAG